MNPDASSDLSTNNSRMSIGAGQQRMTRLRTGSASIEQPAAGQYWVNNEWHQAGTLFADNAVTTSDAMPADASGVVAVDKNMSEYGKLGVFVNVAVMKAGQDGDGAELESDAKTSVLTVGTDYRFTDAIVGGVAVNLSQTKTDFESAFTSGSLDADGYALLFYGSYYVQNWFVDASYNFGNDSYDQFRAPSIGNTYDASFDAQQQTFSSTLGYDFVMQALTVTPFAQIVVGVVDTDAYREQPGNTLLSNAAIGMDQSSKDIGNINLGANLHYVVNTNHGVFIPTFSMTAVEDFEDDAQIISGYFVVNPNPADSFAMETNGADTYYFVVSGGFSFQLKGGNSGFVNLETVEGLEMMTQHRITAGWRWEI
jgi:uncharacterized protein YhjY with autotransporter beta-barrel domain